MKARLTKQEKEREIVEKTLIRNVCDFYPGVEVPDFMRRLHDWIGEFSEYDILRLVNDGEYDSYYVSLVGFREENDEEYERRTTKLLEQKQKTLDKQEREERKLMKQLLKKYGKDS